MLIDARGNIKIVDFGLSNTYAQLREATTHTVEELKTACGSPCYAAPEMIAGSAYSGLAVDLWSLGVVLHAMLSGSLPFEDENTSNLYRKILALEFDIPTHFSSAARSIVRGILCDCEERLGLNQIKKHAFYRQVELTSNPGLVIGRDKVDADERLLQLTCKYGFKEESLRRCIESNAHNQGTTTYYLLMGKRRREGFESTADINSSKFDRRKDRRSMPLSGTNKYQRRSQQEKQPLELRRSGEGGILRQTHLRKAEERSVLRFDLAKAQPVPRYESIQEPQGKFNQGFQPAEHLKGVGATGAATHNLVEAAKKGLPFGAAKAAHLILISNSLMSLRGCSSRTITPPPKGIVAQRQPTALK